MRCELCNADIDCQHYKDKTRELMAQNLPARCEMLGSLLSAFSRDVEFTLTRSSFHYLLTRVFILLRFFGVHNSRLIFDINKKQQQLHIHILQSNKNIATMASNWTSTSSSSLVSHNSSCQNYLPRFFFTALRSNAASSKASW